MFIQKKEYKEELHYKKNGHKILVKLKDINGNEYTKEKWKKKRKNIMYFSWYLMYIKKYLIFIGRLFEKIRRKNK